MAEVKFERDWALMQVAAHRVKLLFGLAQLPAAAELHGNMSQTARLEALDDFRKVCCSMTEIHRAIIEHQEGESEEARHLTSTAALSHAFVDACTGRGGVSARH